MPLYEYQCPDCEQAIELLVRLEEATPACPDCGSERLDKLLSVCATPSGGGRPDPQPPEGPCGSACGCFPQG